MGGFNWLHFSDLHLAIDPTFVSECNRDYLLEFLKNETSSGRTKCDYVFLTGDIANRGKFKGVADFITRLLNAIDMNDALDRVFWAVGNHDIHRSSKVREAIIHNIRKDCDSASKFEQTMSYEETREILLNRGTSYFRKAHYFVCIKRESRVNRCTFSYRR